MNPYYADESVTLHHGDCLDVLAELLDNSVDAVVCDPPYGLANTTPEQVGDTLVRWINGDRDYIPSGKGFMGKSWDAFVPPVAVWDECLRVLKPGGHALVFAGTRTVDLMALSLRLAGFDIRDSIAWLYGSGFPKSLDVGKAIDKAAGATREVVGERLLPDGRPVREVRGVGNHKGWDRPWKADEAAREANLTVTAPATPAAQQWQGWHTALKPAFEPIVVARKPLVGTVAANVLAHGTGALNVDGCRVTYQSDSDKASARPQGAATSRVGALAGKAQAWTTESSTALTGRSTTAETTGTSANSTAESAPSAAGTARTGFTPKQSDGRWPANVLLDGSQAALLDEQSGTLKSGALKPYTAQAGERVYAHGLDRGDRVKDYTSPVDTGGASRFFPTFRYQAKAPTRERPSYVKDGAGTGRVTGLGGKVRQCNVCETRAIESGASEPSCGHGDYRWEQPTTDTTAKVAHPTVKPLALMQWLVRLVTPPGGVVLEPFAGSGTTVEAAILEGFRCIAIEREADYLPLILARIARVTEAATPTNPAQAAAEALALFDFEEPA